VKEKKQNEKHKEKLKKGLQKKNLPPKSKIRAQKKIKK